MKWGWGLLVMLMATTASAHDWYPIECCHGQDCAPVEMAVASDDGVLKVVTKHGEALVPRDFPRRESKDHKMHACMRPGEGGTRLICIFMPPGS